MILKVPSLASCFLLPLTSPDTESLTLELNLLCVRAGTSATRLSRLERERTGRVTGWWGSPALGRARPPSRRVLVTPHPHPRSLRLPHALRWESRAWRWIPVPDSVLTDGNKQGPPSPLRPGPAPSAWGGQVQPPANGGRDGGWAGSGQVLAKVVSEATKGHH